ncbi:MAG TPA: cytochrome c maturation protein CcmE [Candidatus Limnocylindria bacterium]|nr:cytochrome c maturation protein CcmE [Candidatus Limnocylindria bacterium]
MTVSAPAPPPLPRRSRWGLVVAGAVVVAVIGYFAFSGIGDALVYYRTPTEVLAMGPAERGHTIRLGGLVQQGTLVCSNGQVAFTLTDGTHAIPVRNAANVAVQCPKMNAGAVVEGTLGADGSFAATEILIKHNEVYVVPTQGAVPSHIASNGN